MAMLRRPVVVGRRLAVPSNPKTTRALIRRHLALDKKTITHDLSAILGMREQSAKALMTKQFPLAPQHIDRIIDGLKLDDFDAYELRLAGAIEAGWQLHKGQPL